MNHLSRNDYAVALQLLTRIEAQTGDLDSFARAVVQALNDYVASELTTLSVCDLRTGHRELVGRHGFQRSVLHGDYCRRIGLEYTMAVPLFSDCKTLVSLELNRRGLDFSERDRERLDLLRPHLAFLCRHACQAAGAPADAVPARLPGLTLREAEVMHWLACGKTDAEIAALLSISPRTVQKHLEHIYVKLGVETRTAAVMRMLAISDRTIMHEPSSPRQEA